MPDPNKTVELFTRLLFDHPDMDGLWKAVVSIYPNPGDPNNPFTPHAAARDIGDVVKCIASRRTRRQNNTYLCMSALAEVKSETTKDGYPKISRVVKNAICVKDLYVDVDVGKNGCYQTSADAEAGMRNFLADTGMPDPTMQVYTGSGGFHLHWCLDKPLPIAEWQPLAEALKACAKHHGFLIDPAITADPVRILRVPTTFNHKWNPPTECQLNMSSSFKLYTKDTFMPLLAAHMIIKTGPSQQASGGPAPNLSGTAQNFTAGVGESPPVPVDAVATICPATADILARGGNGDAEPLWNLALLLASFTTDPKNAAHRLSSGDPRYTPAGTDQKLQEKLNARAANPKLGWPSCQQFNALHPACKTCPYLNAGKSPFHFVRTAQPASPKVANDPLMPEGYWRNVNDHVFTTNDKGFPIDVLGAPVKDGFIAKVDGHKQLVGLIEVGGRDLYVDVDTSQLSPQKISEAWHVGSHRNLAITSGLSMPAIKGFTMAWMQRLLAQHKEIHPRTFGWAEDDTTFVFGDYAYTSVGPQLTYRGKTNDDKFTVKGELQPWLNTMPLIYGNTALEVTVATAFAAPLVHFACPNSLVMSLFSNGSGHGKTTAMGQAQAVWGSPREGMAGLDDTVNSVAEKMKNLSNLPVYWDEMKGDEQMAKLVQLVFNISGGKGKARLNRDITQARVGTYTTMFVAASNQSLLELVVQKAGATDAGALRVFEIEAQPLPVNSAFTRTQSDPMRLTLERNYGVVGSMYADFIARNRDACIKVLNAVGDQLEETVKFQVKERFHFHTMRTIIAGAHLANSMGVTKFDVPAITNLLTDRLETLRAVLATKGHYTMKDLTADDLLAHMLNDIRGRHMIETNIVPPSRALGPAQKVTPVSVEQHLQNIWLQRGQDDGRILCHTRQFEEWLSKNGYPIGLALDTLRKDYKVDRVKATLGKGVSFMKGMAYQAWCFEMTPKVAPPPKDDPRQPKPDTQRS